MVDYINTFKKQLWIISVLISRNTQPFDKFSLQTLGVPAKNRSMGIQTTATTSDLDEKPQQQQSGQGTQHVEKLQQEPVSDIKVHNM